MSSEVETSLNISVLNKLTTTEIVRDSSTPVGMTKKLRAFTIIELLVVISIIIILAGLILSTVGYVQKKGARARAEAEIAAISAALENYKADNGVYPTVAATNSVDPGSDPPVGAKYQAATKFLYGALSGDNENYNNQIDTSQEHQNKTYFSFKPQMLGGTRDTNNSITAVTYIRDPFGNSYGYSTAKASGAAFGYNPTFDLWSVADANPASNQTQWIKNW
jgi:type II secretory pathway pseudopilin PulG